MNSYESNAVERPDKQIRIAPLLIKCSQNSDRLKHLFQRLPASRPTPRDPTCTPSSCALFGHGHSSRGGFTE